MRRGLGMVLVVLAAAGCSSAHKAASLKFPPTSTTTAGGSETSAAKGCGTSPSGGAAGGGGDVAVPGDIPDTQAFVSYASTLYHLDVPEGWARRVDGPTVTFSDRFNSIRVTLGDQPAAPSVAGAQASEVPRLARSAPCFQAGRVSQVARKSGAAVLITYRASSAPDSVTGKVVVLDVEQYDFWRNGKQATITLSSPKGSDNVDPWRRVTDSFAWT